MADIFIKLKIRSDNLAAMMADLEKLPQRVLNETEGILLDEGRKSATRIVMNHFGSETGPKAFGAPLRMRSGDAMLAISARKTKRTKNRVEVEVGGMNAPDDILKYLETQEIGRTIRPAVAQKLAFPPGDAGEPTRDARGVQILTAREFLEDPTMYGYSYVKWTEDEILAREIGAGPNEFDLLFLRRASVTIPARAPVLSEMQGTEDNIFNRLGQLEL